MRIRTPHVIRSSRRDADKVPSADVQRPAVLLPQGLLDDRLHVLVLADTHEAARELSDRFDPDSREWTVTLAAPGRGTSPDIATAVDVVVLSLARCSTDVMAFGLGLRDVLDDPEYVYVCGKGMDPARHALNALGIGRVIDSSDARRWIAEACAGLSTMARARRLARAADRCLPPIPDPGDIVPTAALFEAERRFREVDVQGVLSQTSTRTEAADKAGVPYRTFCNILSKMGISPSR